jgi:hypothetical protein
MSALSAFIRRNWLDCIAVATLICVALAVRVPIAMERKHMPSGDAFNFQHIASQIQYLRYPSHEKRLPGYAIGILIGRTLGFPPIPTSVGISLMASTGTLLSLYGLGRVFNFSRAALLAFLGLAVFDPLLVLNGVRALSDGLFVFLVATTFFLTALLMRFPQRATPRLRLAYSLVVTLLMFTRYEGFLIAALTAPFLFLALPWRRVLAMAAIPIAAVILWIPAYLHIQGSLGGLSYITDATKPGGGFGDVSQIPDNLDRLMNGAGWRTLWTYPPEVFDKGFSLVAWQQLLSSAPVWIAALSVIGLAYMMAIGRWAGVSIVLAAAGYALLLSWWWVYSRYVAPLSILFYFGAAGGLSAVMAAASYALNRMRVPNPGVLAAFVPLLAIPLVTAEAPRLDHSAVNQAWEANRKGYALYEAMVFVSKQTGLVVYATREHANATLFFGVAGQQKSRANPARGVYLSDMPGMSAADAVAALSRLRPRWFVATDFDSRAPDMLALLKSNGAIAGTTVFRETPWDTWKTDTITVYELRWP